MEYRSLGRTGVRVSPLCLGCMMFGGRTEPTDAMDIIDRAIDAGINFLDTANVYSRGRSEEAVGQALRRNGKRQQIILATKVHGRMADDDPNAAGNHRQHIMQQVEASLRRLQTDYIDLYQIHRPESSVPIDETLRALDDLVRSGKVRYIGSSTFAAWQLMEALSVARELGLNRFVSEQPPYNLMDRRIERELIPFAQTYGTAILPWSPLAGGFLTGKYQRGQNPAGDSRYGGRSDDRTATLFSEQGFQVMDVVAALAQEKGHTPAQVALAWVMHRPAVTAPIIGPRTMAQLEDNLGALEVTLTDDDLQRIDEVSPPGRVIVPYYEADFGPHVYR
jgi:aryl-alcohol dehydrogenase-like predicted oxidoreductase